MHQIQSQKDVFNSGEGDAYFRRNDFVHDVAKDPIFRMLEFLGQIPASVLEIGCSDGWRLNAIFKTWGSACSGIDPSAKAIAEGNRRFPNLSLTRGTAESLPFENKSFDLVIFGFCLYVVDREDLFRIVAEADRVLRSNGRLVIHDFDPPAPSCNDYRHQPGLSSYKLQHENLFLANPAYTLISKHVSAHSGSQDPGDPNDRVATTVLRKAPDSAYLVGPSKWAGAATPRSSEAAEASNGDMKAQAPLTLKKPLVLEHLVLRMLTPSDATPEYLGWMQDPMVYRYLESRFANHTLESLRAYIETSNESSSDLLFGICLRDSGRHIGNIRLGPIDRHHRHSAIGLLIGARDCWGKGYATEAIAGVTAYAFEELGLEKLYAGCYASNEGSYRAFLKVGYVREALSRGHWFCEGRREDNIQIGLLLSDWRRPK